MIDRTVEAVVFDWDSTVVTRPPSSAARLRRRVLALTAAGVDVAALSGTDVENVDRQLRARPAGPGRLWLCANQGSELFEVTQAGPHLMRRRVASAAEDAALDAATARTIDILRRRGLGTRLLAPRLNRRVIDLQPQWADPPERQTAELLTAATNRLRQQEIGDLSAVVRIATEAAVAEGLSHPAITSTAKYLEIGLTNKSDSIRELLALLARRGVGPGLVLIVGSEFGPIDSQPGSDYHLLIPEAQRAITVSVGAEPYGVPPGVRQLHSGAPTLLTILDEQTRRRRARRVPGIDEDPAWIIREDSSDPLRHRVSESICTLGAGGLATRGSVEE